MQDINGLIRGLLIVLEPCSSHSSKVCRLGRITSDIFIGDLRGNCLISGCKTGWHVPELDFPRVDDGTIEYNYKY